MYSSGVDIGSSVKLNNDQQFFDKKSLPIYEKYIPVLISEVRELAVGMNFLLTN